MPTELTNQKTTVIKIHAGNKRYVFTNTKKRKFLKRLAENYYNITEAAQYAGVTRQTIYRHIEEDPNFKNMFDAVSEGYQDKLVETSFNVALRPEREGYNDRRLLAEALDPRFKKQPEVQINQQFNIKVENAMPELKRLVEKIQPNEQVEEADFDDIE